MNSTAEVSRRAFLGTGVRVAAGGASVAVLGSCAPADSPQAEAPRVVPRPQLQPVSMEGTTVNLLFGESPEEAGVLWGRRLPEGYEGSLTEEPFTFDGQFTTDESYRLSGSADVTLSDGSAGRIEIEAGQIRIEYLDETLVWTDVATLVVQRGGEEASLDALYEELRVEASSAGISSLSNVSRALTILAALWHVPDVIQNTAAVRQYEASVDADDTDYGWWCEVWAQAGAIAMGVLGVVGCALLLAGCAGTVVLDGLGVVSCVTANIICGLVGMGLAGLVEALKRLLWAYDEVEA